MAEFPHQGQTHLFVGRDIQPSLVVWNGFEFKPLPQQTNGKINALLPTSGDKEAVLYAGGAFTSASCCGALNHVAQWNGTTWSPLGTGLDGDVNTLVLFDDGTGEKLCAGGDFFQNQFEGIHHIAKWTGTSWQPLTAGLPVFNDLNGPVYAMCVFDDGTGPALYVGGQFTSASGTPTNRIAKWNGSSWSALGAGMNASVRALVVHDDGSGPALYAGGQFTLAAGVPAAHLAKWTGETWSAIPGALNNAVYALRSSIENGSPILNVGGTFTQVAGTACLRTAKWDGTNWISPAPGLADGSGNPDIVYTFGEYQGQLFTGGDFALDIPNHVATQDIARWNETGWTTLGAGVSDRVDDIIVFDPPGDELGPAIYAGGRFSHAQSQIVRMVARWDGSSWTPLGAALNGYCTALKAFDLGDGPTIYSVGDGSLVSSLGSVLKWNGSAWIDLGFGDTIVDAAEGFDSGAGPAIYVGGQFSSAGSAAVTNIAKWNGSAWSAVGSGVNGRILCLKAFDDGSGPALFAGGGFTHAGTIPAKFIAKWNGTGWSAVGGGLNGPLFSGVFDLEVFDDGSGPALYAAGNFTTAGGQTVNGIARWNGTSWSALGSGANNAVLELFGGGAGLNRGLYAGGAFTQMGGLQASRIARWRNGTWEALENGADNEVLAIQYFDNGSEASLYIGGQFQTVDNVQSRWIAKRALCQPELDADLNGDGLVNVDDLLMLLAAWGPCGEMCAADIAPPSGDTLVNVDDLLLLLANWG